MSSLLIQNAWAVVTCDDQDSLLENASILIRDGVITYMGPEPQTADEVLDASRCVVYPGLVNTHHHLYQTFSLSQLCRGHGGAAENRMHHCF